MGCVTVGPGKLGEVFLLDFECCFDVKEDMHCHGTNEKTMVAFY